MSRAMASQVEPTKPTLPLQQECKGSANLLKSESLGD